MNKKIILGSSVLIFMTVFFFGCATGESVYSPALIQRPPDRVAVVEISGAIRGEYAKKQVEDYLSMEMMRKGYRIIERSRVDTLLKEQDFQASDITTASQAAEVGRILNIPAVLMLDVQVSGEKLSLTGRMVESETGEVLWIGSGRGSSTQALSTVGGALAGGVIGSQIGSGRGQDLATVSGAVIGGMTGYALSPQAQRLIQRAIKQMVDDLPAAR